MNELSYSKELGNLLAELRINKGYSQRKLAMMANVSNTTISRIEKGETENPDIDTLKKVAPCLGKTVNELLEHIGYIENENISNNIQSTKKEIIKDYQEVVLSKKELEDINSFTNNVFENFLFNAFKGDIPADQEEEEKVKTAVFDAFVNMKKRNKIKYNPNKNK